jgi:hypothetical protein
MKELFATKTYEGIIYPLAGKEREMYRLTDEEFIKGKRGEIACLICGVKTCDHIPSEACKSELDTAERIIKFLTEEVA